SARSANFRHGKTSRGHRKGREGKTAGSCEWPSRTGHSVVAGRSPMALPPYSSRGGTSRSRHHDRRYFFAEQLTANKIEGGTRLLPAPSPPSLRRSATNPEYSPSRIAECPLARLELRSCENPRQSFPANR